MEEYRGPEEKTSLIVRGEEGTLGVAARRMNPIYCVCLALAFVGMGSPRQIPLVIEEE